VEMFSILVSLSISITSSRKGTDALNPAVFAPLIFAIGFVAYCLFDLSRTEEVRYLPKWAWAFICLITVPLGGIVYLTVGRAR